MVLSKHAAEAQGLTPKQQAFVEATVRGAEPNLAAELAGYSDPGKDSWRLTNTPSVASAIRAIRERQFVGHPASAALKVVMEIIEDPENPPAVRLSAARYILEVAGHVPKTVKSLAGSQDEKPLHEMTLEELRAERARLDQVESMIADAAKVVEEVGPSVPPEVQE